MGLSNDLLSQFAKLTNNKTKQITETTVYGTVKSYDGSLYVQLDGSELLTPVETTANYKVGERVSVQIKNHTATVTGNLSSPAARSGDVIPLGDKVTTEDINAINANINALQTLIDGLSDKITTEQLNAVNADIENIRADYAHLDHISAEDIETITLKAEAIRSTVGEFTNLSTSDLEAIDASISNLIAYNAKFTYVSAEVLKAVKADISQLNVDKLSVKDAELTYANIEFSNIKMAAVEKLFTKAGIIEHLTVGDVTSTGEWVGVKFKGDLIEANTLKADRLLVQGEDGLYYRLNVNSLGETTAASDPKYQNGLDGSVIVAESIAAEKISVKDLESFKATIGGFHITDSSIYSGVKESIDNTTKGIYMGSDGQFSIGDSKNYLKFFEDTDGNYIFKTSYMESTDDGLVIGNLAEATLKGNVLIDDDSIDIRIGDKVLASYEGENIYLGKNSADSTIDLCDGTGTISNYPMWHNDECRELDIYSNGSATIRTIFGSNLYSCGTFFADDNSEIYYQAHTYANGVPYYDSYDMPCRSGLTSYYRKTTYNNDSSHSYIDNTSNVNANSDDFSSYIQITTDTWDDDYIGSAAIELASRSANYDSYISFDADRITFYGDAEFLADALIYVDGAGPWKPMLGYKDDTKYYGMVTPEGSDTGWIRTTESGILPYTSGGSSSCGTINWPFNVGSFNNLYAKGIKTFYSAGDTVSGVWRCCSGFLSGSSKKIYFTIPLSKPIIGTPSITINSINGLRLRQHGYVCGSAGGKYITSVTYEAARAGGDASTYKTVGSNGINVIATISNTTDALNDYPIAVDASVSITFS